MDCRSWNAGEANQVSNRKSFESAARAEAIFDIGVGETKRNECGEISAVWGSIDSCTQTVTDINVMYMSWLTRNSFASMKTACIVISCPLSERIVIVKV
jgi:hypothetical protein